VNIRIPRPDELPLLQSLEVAAGILFRDIGMTDVAAHPPPPLEVFEHARRAGLLWVSTEKDQPTGFVLVELVDDAAHIEQVSVHPDYQGRGIGGALIDQVDSWAAEKGLPALTLSTFRDVPWNGPYYARLGFLEVGELTPGLVAVRDAETAMGLDPADRIVMRRVVARQ
jgi:GNAT superfamily N-acetyltransferase